MTNVKSILSRALKKVVPSAPEINKLQKVTDKIRSAIQGKLNQMGVIADVFIGGSIAKGTWMKGSYDIDFFVRFDKGLKDEEMSTAVSKAVKMVFGACNLVHGSRDYCKAKYKNYLFEFIPTVKIAEPEHAKNSMDASIFHVEYIKKKISKNRDLANQIRLFKLFLKSNGLYGAETYISGLSGYVAELLMIYYGSFKNLVSAAENMKPPIVIDLEKRFKSRSDIKKNIFKENTKVPMVVIDPVLKRRNAAAALSYETFSRMVLALRLFSRNPSMSFFTMHPLDLDKVKKASKEHGTILLTKKLLIKGNKDVFMAKVKKALARTERLLKGEGVALYNKGYFFEDNKVVAFVELETLKLPKKKKHCGPPVWANKSNFDAFLKKWRRVYADGHFVVVDVKRDSTSLKKLASNILKGAFENVR